VAAFNMLPRIELKGVPQINADTLGMISTSSAPGRGGVARTGGERVELTDHSRWQTPEPTVSGLTWWAATAWLDRRRRDARTGRWQDQVGAWADHLADNPADAAATLPPWRKTPEQRHDKHRRWCPCMNITFKLFAS
jgi:hypothetical protein